MSKITVQEILSQLKALEGGLVGISRTNKPLHFQLKSRITKLQKRLTSSCDDLQYTNDKHFVGVKRLEALLAEAKEEANFRDLRDNLQYLIEGANGELERKEAEAKQVEAGKTAEAIKAATTKKASTSIEIASEPKDDVESEDDDDLLAKVSAKSKEAPVVSDKAANSKPATNSMNDLLKRNGDLPKTKS